MYVEDVEDRSNTPKGCNAMYVEDVEDDFITSLNGFSIRKKFWKAETAFQPYHQIHVCHAKIDKLL